MHECGIEKLTAPPVFVRTASNEHLWQRLGSDCRPEPPELLDSERVGRERFRCSALSMKAL